MEQPSSHSGRTSHGSPERTNRIGDPYSTTAWGPVICMSLLTFVLIASEFMPVSLLTPIAHELGTTEGQAGQAIAISGLFAILTSLFGNSALSRFDRRTVVLFYSGVIVVSGLTVALAPNYAIFMIGRALLGVTIGGFGPSPPPSWHA
jgi:predicted MFS family arabinose efflux permease